MSRSRRRFSAGVISRVPLLLLAGLPNSTHNRGAALLESIVGGRAKAIAVPSGANNAALFPEKTVEALLRAASGFAIRRLNTTHEDQPPTPTHILLFYVPALDDENLLAAMDFFVFPIPLLELAVYDNSGRQKRHDAHALKQGIESALVESQLEEDFIKDLKRRISSVRASEPLLLPPANFHLDDRNRLTRVFRELRRGTRRWRDPIPEMSIERFDQGRLPDFLASKEKKDAYKDTRSVVFPCARPREFHSVLREIESESSVEELRDFLRSSYRFGVPLPDGFHHDAQFEAGRKFHKMPFDCTREGPVVVSGPHANVYPNDFVRADVKDRA